MRADRFQAAAGHSQHIWELLRQESNVAIGEIKLGGTNNRRRVDISVAVDGTDTPALAVMSQGELHAFGLALFLPRACADASPYRFVVIDDPVQSMDPAKVDGLAELLREVSRTRQVVVFTHDDRLPEAIRRLGVEADVREVTRREGSVVEVRKNLWPAKRYLDDARAVALTEDIPEDARRLMVAGFCRSALEAAAMDRYRMARYAAGASQREIDAVLNAAHTVHDKLALGVFRAPGRRRALNTHLDRCGVPRAVDTVKAVAKAMHEPCDMASLEMVETSEALVEMLR
ncbi:AAA family ATPase [Asanoa sp. NPDC049573]|uniref:AAA family ATPase n=1 Tax=Asanoa sp. NPDC049573 TaxID=3155396 RepID=UPI0034445FAE